MRGGWDIGHKEKIAVMALGNELDSMESCGTFATFGNGALAHAQGTMRPLPRDGRYRGQKNTAFLRVTVMPQETTHRLSNEC